MTVARRRMMLGSLGLGVAVATDPRMGSARETESPQPLSTYGVLPGGGIDQTARLQEAADAAAKSGTPPFPSGRGLRDESAHSQIRHPTFKALRGSPSLRYRDGGAILNAICAT
jgi:hypothetical protein